MCLYVNVPIWIYKLFYDQAPLALFLNLYIFEFCSHREVSELIVSIIQARDLMANQYSGTLDTYIRGVLLPETDTKFQTKVRGWLCFEMTSTVSEIGDSVRRYIMSKWQIRWELSTHERFFYDTKKQVFCTPSHRVV